MDGTWLNCAYIGFLTTKQWGYIVLECYDQHLDPESICDMLRDFDIATSVALGCGIVFSNDAMVPRKIKMLHM